MFIPSKTAFNVYSKFTTLRKYPSIAPLFPPIVHSYYDQTEGKMSRLGRLISPQFNRKKVAACEFKDNKAFKNPWNATWISKMLALDDWLLKGDLHHIVFRKLVLHRTIQDRLMNSNSPITQLVILGSGIDHIGWVFSDKCACFELDIEPIITFKKKLLPTLNQKVHLIDFDATKNTLDQCLKKHPTFHSNRPSLFITEGFIDYIPKENLVPLLSQIKHLNPKNEWLSTHFDRSLLSRKERFFFEFGIKITGEQLQSNLDKEQVTTIGSNIGFALINEWSNILEQLGNHSISNEAKLNKIEGKVLHQNNMNGCSILHFK
jgi:O-methyltransferase involved in polyketide biosynthesis